MVPKAPPNVFYCHSIVIGTPVVKPIASYNSIKKTPSRFFKKVPGPAEGRADRESCGRVLQLFTGYSGKLRLWRHDFSFAPKRPHVICYLVNQNLEQKTFAGRNLSWNKYIYAGKNPDPKSELGGYLCPSKNSPTDGELSILSDLSVVFKLYLGNGWGGLDGTWGVIGMWLWGIFWDRSFWCRT